MKSDAWIESDQNSTWALRDPTLNKLDLQELSKSNASPGLLWSCKGPDLRAAGSPMSFQFIREAKSYLGSSSEVPKIKMAYRNWKGLWKDWSRRTGMKRTTIGSKITGFETRISRPLFLSLCLESFPGGFFSLGNTPLIVLSIGQIVNHICWNSGPTVLRSIGNLNQSMTLSQMTLSNFFLSMAAMAESNLASKESLNLNCFSLTTFFQLIDWSCNLESALFEIFSCDFTKISIISSFSITKTRT